VNGKLCEELLICTLFSVCSLTLSNSESCENICFANLLLILLILRLRGSMSMIESESGGIYRLSRRVA
jgi:hypothetical protein